MVVLKGVEDSKDQPRQAVAGVWGRMDSEIISLPDLREVIHQATKAASTMRVAIGAEEVLTMKG